MLKMLKIKDIINRFLTKVKDIACFFLTKVKDMSVHVSYPKRLLSLNFPNDRRKRSLPLIPLTSEAVKVE